MARLLIFFAFFVGVARFCRRRRVLPGGAD